MRVLLRTTSPGLEIIWGRFAVVRFDKALMNIIRNRRTLYKAARAADKHLQELYFYDLHCRFYDELPRKVLDDDLDSYIVLSKTDRLPKEETRTECDRMVIYEDGVAWHACIKHTDAEVNTYEIHYEDLERLYKKAHSPRAGANTGDKNTA